MTLPALPAAEGLSLITQGCSAIKNWNQDGCPLSKWLQDQFRGRVQYHLTISRGWIPVCLGAGRVVGIICS
jgi:hypothetical protein